MPKRHVLRGTRQSFFFKLNWYKHLLRVNQPEKPPWDDIDPALIFFSLIFFSAETGESHSFPSPLERVPSLELPEVGTSWRLVVYSSGSRKTLHLFRSLFWFGPKMFSECSARCSACLCVISCTAVCMWLSVLRCATMTGFWPGVSVKCRERPGPVSFRISWTLSESGARLSEGLADSALHLD